MSGVPGSATELDRQFRNAEVKFSSCLKFARDRSDIINVTKISAEPTHPSALGVPFFLLRSLEHAGLFIDRMQRSRAPIPDQHRPLTGKLIDENI